MVEGIVKRLFENRGYGFIKVEDGREVFFHETSLQNIRFDLLKEGDPVEFNVMEGPKGPRAVYVVVKEKEEGTSGN